MTRRSLSLLLCSAPWLKAADAWKEKKAADWSPTDIKKLGSNSPWAKEALVSMGSGPGRGGPGAESSGGGGRKGGGGGGGGMGGGGAMGGDMGGGGGGGGRGGGGGGGGMEGGGGGMSGGAPQIKAIIRWESAQPFIDAAKRQRSKEAEKYYIVSATGLPMMDRQPRAQPDGKQAEGKQMPSPEDRRKAMIARMKESTMLERKGKDPIYPERVELLETNGGGRLLVFLFPREGQAITAVDKEVTFHTKMGAMELKAKFPLKDMTYEGKLEL